ncbi:MAG: lipopolysaccharide transport system ATP-binding protein [Candidatus Sumerlaeota bacterium]|nr:lipopolysaccharide transport system ATP-binding protein [Candidatus Sumerlaeota bacterium]
MTNDSQQAKAPAFARQLETTPRAGAGTWAVRMQGIGKQYRLGAARQASDNLREDVTNALRSLVTGGAGRQPLFWALRGVDLEVARGESVGIIGRNGAGKSTLLKILSRITPPTTGEMRYRGRLASLLEVGTGFHRELTGRENIYLNGSILGMRRHEIARQFDAIVDFAGVEQFLDTPVKFYSSGMYVRLAFAVAAHLRTDILVVDEVLAVGDAAFQKKCLGKMQDAASDGRTVLFVSHNMAAVESLCSKAILIESGSITRVGRTSEVVGHYFSGNGTGGFGAIPEDIPRSGTGQARFTAAYLLDETGQPVNSVFMGDSIRIAASFRVKPGGLLTPRFGVRICTLRGICAARFTTKETYGEVAPIMGEAGHFLLDLEGLRLLPGKYAIELGFSEAGQMVDFIEQAATFEVRAKNTNPDHKVIDNSMAITYAECQWNFSGVPFEEGSP